MTNCLPLLGVGRNISAGDSPSSISNLEIWLQSGVGYYTDAGITPAVNNDLVYQWNDSSGNARHVTQTTSADRPVLLTNTLNGEDVLSFSTSGEFFNVPTSISGFSAGDVYIVVKIAQDPPGNTGYTGLWTFTSSSDNTHYCWTDGNIYEGFGSTTRVTVGDPTPSLTSYRLYNVSSASSDYKVYLDGTNIYTSGSNTVGWASTPYLGQGFISGAPFPGPYFLVGEIAEFFIYSKILNSTERTLIKNYISSKFGLTIA